MCENVPKDPAGPQLPASFLIALILSTVNLAVSQPAFPGRDVLLRSSLQVS